MSNGTADSGFKYAGSELALFETASNWKAYWSGQIRDYVRGDVLEAGAGAGANTRLLANLAFDSWTCLEPDAALLVQIEPAPSRRHRSICGTIENLDPEMRFDAILYIDVLEHIEDDRAEMKRAAERLKPAGCLIVLAPAHPFLFTPFDSAIGHFRRYTRKSLQSVIPAGLETRRLVYLDAAGMAASGANLLLLRSAMPTAAQVLTWDRLLVPVSRRIDRALGWRAGKSVLGIWQRSRTYAEIKR
ncbi:MAG: class I SAM-dependent methyltransferase [Bryobacteraceae bacterium]